MKRVGASRFLFSTFVLLVAWSQAQAANNVPLDNDRDSNRSEGQIAFLSESKADAPSTRETPEALIQEGTSHFQNRDFPSALADLQQSVDLSRQTDNSHAQSRALTLLAMCYEAIGKHQRALENLSLALKVQRRVQDRQGEAHSLSDIGNIYRFWGYPEEGIRHLKAALALCSALQQCSAKPKILNHLGMAFFDLRDYRQALEYYQKALQLYRESGNEPRMALVLNNIGAVYNATSRFSDALVLLLEANSLARRVEASELLALNLSNIGFSYVALQEPAQAEKSYREALVLYRDLGIRNRETDMRMRLDHLGLSISRH